MAQEVRLPDWFKEASSQGCARGATGAAPGFIDKNLGGIHAVMRSLMDSEQSASKPGFLQRLDTRAKITGIFIVILTGALAHKAVVLGVVLAFCAACAALSGIGITRVAKRVAPAAFFTFVLVFPLFFVMRAGYHEAFGVTVAGYRVALAMEGLENGFFLMLRVAAMVAPAALLLLSTRQTDFFRGLRGLPVPSFFVTALFMTFRYIFILLKMAEDVSLAKKSRTLSRANLKESQKWFASRVALFLKKSLNMAEEVNMAMSSRGFTGKIKTFDTDGLALKDYAWIGAASFIFFLSLGI